MPSRSPSAAQAGALLARKLELLEGLSSSYEGALRGFAASDLGQAAELVDTADRLVEDLTRVERTLRQRGIVSPESLHDATSEVHGLHARLRDVVACELEQTREERRRVAAFRNKLASRLDTDQQTGSLLDSSG